MVPALADEAGGAETRSDGAEWQPCHDAVADPGMDIDVVDNQESVLRELFNVITRDAVSEVREHDDAISSVIKAPGGHAGKYKRERRAAIQAPA